MATQEYILNQITISGNVAFKPELKYLPSGRAVANTKIYSTRRWVDKASGDKKEKTVEVKLVAWGETAEDLANNVGQGDFIEVFGELEASEAWVDKTSGEVKTLPVLTVREGRVVFTKRVEGQVPVTTDETAVDANLPPLPDAVDEFGDIPF